MAGPDLSRLPLQLWSPSRVSREKSRRDRRQRDCDGPRWRWGPTDWHGLFDTSFRGWGVHHAMLFDQTRGLPSCVPRRISFADSGSEWVMETASVGPSEQRNKSDPREDVQQRRWWCIPINPVSVLAGGVPPLRSVRTRDDCTVRTSRGELRFRFLWGGWSLS